MRPPVPVPTLSRRAKLVIGVVAALLVLFTVVGTLTNVYVDYLWFDETSYTEVFWTEVQTRALLFAVAGVATGGLVALSIYLAYKHRPTFRPMSLEQQNLERYRQSLEPRRTLVLGIVAVVLGLFLALKAVAYWLDRYGLVYSDRGGVFTGASYTDVNALLVPKTILVFVATVCALAFFANIVVRNFLLPASALVLLLLSSLVIGVAYPAIVQQFVVRPSADQKEAPYIKRAIQSTLDAYNLDKIDYVNYAQEATGDSVDTDAAQAELRNDTETIPNARLLDPNVLSETFTARQQIRNVYGFPEKLDIDRYTIDGETRDYVVAVRELNSEGLSENQDTWINRHTVYTHGNGFVAAPANRVVAGQEGGEPNFTTRDLPTVGDIDVEQPRIYYGELIRDYSVVGAPEGAAPREFDQPEGGSG